MPKSGDLNGTIFMRVHLHPERLNFEVKGYVEISLAWENTL